MGFGWWKDGVSLAESIRLDFSRERTTRSDGGNSDRRVSRQVSAPDDNADVDLVYAKMLRLSSRVGVELRII